MDKLYWEEVEDEKIEKSDSENDEGKNAIPSADGDVDEKKEKTETELNEQNKSEDNNKNEETFADKLTQQSREFDELIDELNVDPSDITPDDIDAELASTSMDDEFYEPEITSKPEQDEDYKFSQSKQQADKSQNKVLKNTLMILFIMLNVGIIAYTAYKDFSKPAQPSAAIDFGIINFLCILSAFMCVGTALLMETVKYMMMMRSTREKVSFKSAFQVSALGKYYDCITPSGAGGQPFQIFYLYQQNYSNASAAAMPLTGFLTMQSGFVILALFVFVFKNDAINSAPAIKVSAYLGLLFYLAVPLIIVLFCIFPNGIGKMVQWVIKLGGKMHLVKNVEKTSGKALKSLNDYRTAIVGMAKNKMLMVKLMVCSIIFQIAICSLPYFVIHIFGGNIDFFTSLATTVFVYSAITYIPTPGNSGAAEISFNIIFEQYTPNGLFWAMMTWRFFCYYLFIILGAGIYGYNAIVKNFRKKASETK